MAEVVVPQYSEVARRNILIDSLGGPKDVFYYLENFPDEIYNKSPDSHLYKYMRSLLGEGGVNWLKKNLLEARLALEELGIDAFDLDQFFGSPFSFGRIIEENLGEDPYGIIPKDQWELIKAKNARYRNRALDYVNGARAGNTPLGMRQIGKAGIGHDIEVIENYKYLFDVHSDDPLGLDYYGKTFSTEEMIILPRREVSLNEQQMILVQGDTYPTSGSFSLVWNGHPTAAYSYTYTPIVGSPVVHPGTIPFDGTADHIRLALEAMPVIGPGGVSVTGGPGPTEAWIVTFEGLLGGRDVPELEIVSNLYAGTTAIDLRVVTIQGGRESTDETVQIPPRDMHSLISAVDRIRPQTCIVTVGEARGLRSRNNWKQAVSSSEYKEVVRFATGNAGVNWPDDYSYQWVRAYEEKQAPRLAGDLQYHYSGFHEITSVESSTIFGPNNDASRAIADYSEPLFITSSKEENNKAIGLINGIYPTEYQALPGIPPIRYKEEQYWASKNWDTEGFQIGQEEDEWLIARMPFVKCVNYVSLDIGEDDVEIVLEYDANDGIDESHWVPVSPVDPYSDIIIRSQNDKWASIGLTFTDRLGQLIWTRAIRIKLQRTASVNGYWGYPIRIRNLRLARNVS